MRSSNSWYTAVHVRCGVSACVARTDRHVHGFHHNGLWVFHTIDFIPQLNNGCRTQQWRKEERKEKRKDER